MSTRAAGLLGSATLMWSTVGCQALLDGSDGPAPLEVAAIDASTEAASPAVRTERPGPATTSADAAPDARIAVIGLAQVVACQKDDDCPLDEGCDVSGGASDGYCTRLCDDDRECAPQLRCPSLEPALSGECDDPKQHRGRGICDLFNGNHGPVGCLREP